MQKMCWRNYSQTIIYKIKIEHISGSIVWSFKQFALLYTDLRAIEI